MVPDVCYPPVLAQALALGDGEPCHVVKQGLHVRCLLHSTTGGLASLAMQSRARIAFWLLA